MPPMLMKHDIDPRAVIMNAIGDLSGVDVFNNTVLVAIYERPDQTKSGVILTQRTREEDQHQGKAALIIKAGRTAFKDPEGKWFAGETIEPGDWIVLRPSDGWPIKVNGVFCRILNDTAVRARIVAPDSVW